MQKKEGQRASQDKYKRLKVFGKQKSVSVGGGAAAEGPDQGVLAVW